jgi:hypothetical protein
MIVTSTELRCDHQPCSASIVAGSPQIALATADEFSWLVTRTHQFCPFHRKHAWVGETKATR